MGFLQTRVMQKPYFGNLAAMEYKSLYLRNILSTIIQSSQCLTIVANLYLNCKFVKIKILQMICANFLHKIIVFNICNNSSGANFQIFTYPL